MPVPLLRRTEHTASETIKTDCRACAYSHCNELHRIRILGRRPSAGQASGSISPDRGEGLGGVDGTLIVRRQMERETLCRGGGNSGGCELRDAVAFGADRINPFHRVGVLNLQRDFVSFNFQECHDQVPNAN